MQVAEDTIDHLAMLNTAQRRAAEFGKRLDSSFSAGPLLVIAGAGTGKTMTLAHRVAHIILEGVSPERILLLTFTRRAAQEMTRRVESIVRSTQRDSSRSPLPSGGLPWSGTFHSVANRLLRRFAHNLNLDPGFSVLDRGDSADVMDVVRHELKLTRTSRRFPKKDTCLAIYSRCVNTQKPLLDTLDSHYPWCSDWTDELSELFRRYVLRKQQNQSLDYDDLLLYWSHLVGGSEFAEEIGSWFDHILVDEYQDTNIIQADILNALKPDGQWRHRRRRRRSVDLFLSRSRGREHPRFSRPVHSVGPKSSHSSRITVRRSPILDSANCLIAESERQYRKNLFSDNVSTARDRVTSRWKTATPRQSLSSRRFSRQP